MYRIFAISMLTVTAVACGPNTSAGRRNSGGSGGGGGGCTENSTRCNGNLQEACNSNQWILRQDCSANGQTCVSDATGGTCSQTCTDGSRRCSGSRIELCSAGMWSQEQDCSTTGETCVEVDATTANCMPPQMCIDGNQRCSGARAEICSAGNWQLFQDCGAIAAACVEVDPTTANCEVIGCINGERRCVGTVVNLCNGGVWMTETDCAASGTTCASGGAGTATCVSAPCTTDGELRCNGNAVELCTGGNWVIQDDCNALGMTCMTNGMDYLCVTPGVGACTNTADQALITDANMQLAAEACVNACVGSTNLSGCVSNCLVTDTGLSRPCADCYGNSAECAAINCLSPCYITPDNATCAACIETSCMGEFSACSGL